jgi:N-acetyl-anhydromuramyl-L-alanine amidase AmpD
MCAPWPLRAHEAPLSANDLNRKSVAICLLGNGQRRAFTDQQTRQLLNLVRALQAELGIGAHAVFFDRELTPMVSGLGKFGQLQPGTFRAQLLP